MLGNTLRQLLDKCSMTESGLDVLTAPLVKKKLAYFEMPVEEHWRVPLLQELLKIRQGHLKLGNLDTMEISYLIDNLCTS